MKSGLKRDLGLLPTMAIAIGAMVGAGIFILPGVAFMAVNGPAVVLAFLLAGILILPAAFSASEMATAMPEDGGSYVFVERGMGPLLGTIAGVEGVIELLSHRDDRTSRIVSTLVVGDSDDEAKAQGKKHLRSCVDAASGVRSPEAAVLH